MISTSTAHSKKYILVYNLDFELLSCEMSKKNTHSGERWRNVREKYTQWRKVEKSGGGAAAQCQTGEETDLVDTEQRGPKYENTHLKM